jgi:ribosomal protein S18 acetylase RimI-like enzyme
MDKIPENKIVGQVVILPMTIEDYDEVIALWKASPGIGLSDADSRDMISHYLESNPGMSFVARDGGKLVGAALCGHDGRRGYLHHLAVHPDHRKSGTGRLLSERCLAALKANGIARCHIFVYANNPGGLAFWNKLGWYERTELKLMSFNIK